MNIVVVGYGSAGRRHLDNLLKLKKVRAVTICTSHAGIVPVQDPRVRFVSSLEDVVSRKSDNRNGFDFAIVANETGRHIETSVLLAGRGLSLFIEKPLSHTVEGINVLEELVRKKGLKAFIAYNFRFMGAIRRIREELKTGRLGKLYFSRIEAGQYLPQWRPCDDYRRSYSASSARGGGVGLDLSHELDYMRMLFGDPVEWKVVRSYSGALEINSEDVFEGIYSYKSGFVCSVHLDYLQAEKKRMIRIDGSKGMLECDLVRKQMSITGEDGRAIIDSADMFDLNSTYLDEILHFIDVIENGREPDVCIKDGIAALRLLEDSSVQG
ncbi:MAG: Gfo/Idh/MocA family oxidoreductase [Deltaproteobacteria bacterium]|nr:Gfo/Idh/MocA family oxidoreductase [Deltaproteobacteria bacterium]